MKVDYIKLADLLLISVDCCPVDHYKTIGDFRLGFDSEDVPFCAYIVKFSKISPKDIINIAYILDVKLDSLLEMIDIERNRTTTPS